MFGFLTSVLKLCQLNVLSPLRDERDFRISFAPESVDVNCCCYLGPQNVDFIFSGNSVVWQKRLLIDIILFKIIYKRLNRDVCLVGMPQHY